MKAAVLKTRDDIVIEEYPMPVPGNEDVLVKIKAVGICGSDIPRVLGDGAHFYPIVLGHEFSGEVVEAGSDVINLKKGDRVAGVPLLPCHKCDDCLKGYYSHCKNYSFIGSRKQGAFAEYISVPQKNAVKFDHSVSYEQGALFEPSTIALHGLLRIDFKGGEDVAILGGGTIGLLTAQWVKIFGAKRVFVFDIDNTRLELCKKMGVDIVINTLEDRFMEQIREYTKGKGFGYVFETAGVDVTMRLSFELAANSAGICFIGIPNKNLVFEPKLFELMNRKEFDLTGSWMSYSSPFPGKEWELTAHFFKTGKLLFDDSIIFKKICLGDIKSGFNMYKTPGSVKGKIMIINE